MQKTLVVAAWMCKICSEFILSWSNYQLRSLMMAFMGDL